MGCLYMLQGQYKLQVSYYRYSGLQLDIDVHLCVNMTAVELAILSAIHR